MIRGINNVTLEEYELDLDLFSIINVENSSWIRTNAGLVFKLIKSFVSFQWERLIKNESNEVNNFKIISSHILMNGDLIAVIVLSNGSKFDLMIGLKNTIKELKYLIEERDGKPFNNKKLIYNELKLKDNQTLDFYKIVNGSQIKVII